MAEVDVVGKVVNLDPGERLTGSPAIADRLKKRCIGPDLRVAVDACLRRGNACVTRLLNARMTVLALEAQSCDVVLVAERDRLFGTLTLASYPWGALQMVQCYSESDHYKPCQHQARSRQSIGAAVKDLRHDCFPACCSLVSRLSALCWRS